MSSTTSPVSALKLGGMKQSEDALSFEREQAESAGGTVIVHFRLKANEEVLRDCEFDCIQTIANLKWYLENERGVVARGLFLASVNGEDASTPSSLQIDPMSLLDYGIRPGSTIMIDVEEEEDEKAEEFTGK
eukprot:g4421.t1